MFEEDVKRRSSGGRVTEKLSRRAKRKLPLSGDVRVFREINRGLAKASASNKLLVEGIVSVATSIKARRIQRLPQPGFVRGTVIDIQIKAFTSVIV